MKLSIIIPTRNRKKMLLELIHSTKDIKSKEIIIIDNNENAKNYTQELAEKKDVFVYRHQNSRSLSDGRNLGLEKAKGEYVFFIDDDDLVHEQFVKFINRYNKSYNVLRFCETHFPKKSRRRPSFSIKWLSKIDRFFLYQQSSFLYKRDLLLKNDLRYKNVYGEDRIFYSDLLKVIKKQRMIHKYSIWYRNSEIGMTRGDTKQIRKNHIILINFLIENNYKNELKRFMKDKKY